MKRFALGVFVGLLIASLFSAPWMYQAWAVGSCGVYRSWNTGDLVEAGDLNASFTVAAVTNSTPQCLDDYSATAGQMQSTVDPFASGTESLATSTAGEIERLRFMFKQIFGLTNWYRHDQAPTFGSLSGHFVTGGLHLAAGSARFPVLTGPDHWTGVYFPADAHLALTFRDPNHAAGGVQGGIELFRFHAGGLVLHHTVSLRFRHSTASNGATTHVTAVQVNGQDQIVLGHSSVALIFHGAGLVQGPNRMLALSSNGEAVTARHIVGTGGLTISHTNTAITFGLPRTLLHVAYNHVVLVSNTGPETSIYAFTIPAGTLGTTGELVLELYGSLVKTSTPSTTIRLKYGATTIATLAGYTFSGTTEHPYMMRFRLLALGSTAAQLGWPEIICNDNGDDCGVIFGNAVEDSTADKRLEVTWHWSVQSASNSFKLGHAVLRLVP